MTRRAAVILGFALAAVVGLAAPHAAARRATTRHVLVGVTDAHGAPVTTLAAADFTITEDGASREILGVQRAAPPSDVALLVDDSAAARDMIAQWRAGLDAFVRGVLAFSPRPATRVVTLGGRPATAVDFTTEPSFLEQGVGKLFPQPGTGAYLLDGIIETTKALQTRSAAAPVIVAFVIERGPEFSTAVHTQVADALARAHASLWTIVLQDPAANLTARSVRERAMVTNDVAVESGGASRQILSKEGIERAMADTVAAIGARYDVTYSRPDALIPPKQIRVKVRTPGLSVAAPTRAEE